MLLFILILILCLGIFILLISKFNDKIAQSIALNISILCFFLSNYLWVFFDKSSAKYQYIVTHYFFDITTFSVHINNFLFSFGVDGISLFFILLSTFIIPLCLLSSYKESFYLAKDYCVYFLILEVFLICSFSATDLILFFIFFESILLPMFFMIGIWGSRERKVRANFLFFLYTLFGSIFLLFSLLVLYYDNGTTSFLLLSKSNVDIDKQLILWVFIYVAFAVKIPTIPLHIWLPEAHVEAPTAGSVILAGLLLKLGGYGFIRVLLQIFSESTLFYSPLTDTLGIISIIYASFTTIRQIDMKRIIAYSSIAHMNLVSLGIFSSNIQGISGSIFLMLAHGIVSSALFFLIGVLYDKYGTRLIYYYGGLVQTMPFFSFSLLVFSFANIGLPGTCNFIGELVVFVGLVDKNFMILFIAVTGVILSVLYTMFFFNRLVFGNLNMQYIFVYEDMILREVYTILPLGVLTIFLGIFPDIVFDSLLTSVSTLIQYSVTS